MAVLAVCVLSDINGQGDDEHFYGSVRVAFMVPVNGQHSATLIIEGMEPDSLQQNLKTYIETQAKAQLQAEPYNMTFGQLDKVRCLTAIA